MNRGNRVPEAGDRVKRGLEDYAIKGRRKSESERAPASAGPDHRLFLNLSAKTEVNREGSEGCQSIGWG